MKEHIDEMTKVLVDYTEKNHIMASHVILEDYAEQLYNAGYRKQCECDLVEVANWAGSIEYKCTACKEGFFHAEYYQYCPFCGAKRKGGAE